MSGKTWHVDVYIDEEGDTTRARAVLTDDSPVKLHASGTSRRSAHVPQIGDELAVAQALNALALELRARTDRDVAALTHRA